MNELPESIYVESRYLERVLDWDLLTNSYKILWFKGIFDEVILGNKIIPFKMILSRMIAYAWFPIVEYKLSFGKQDKLSELIDYIKIKYNFDSDTKSSFIIEILYNNKDEELEKKFSQYYRYVPLRLLTPFYEQELRKLPDAIKNQRIYEMTQLDNKILYNFIPNENKLIMNENWYKYLRDNQSVIYGWIQFKLTYYLQKNNPNTPAIPFKLEPPYKRDLSDATKLWRQINNQFRLKDIYINKEFTIENEKLYGKMSIDHFIPWSFVLHDEIWNLIPSFKKINCSKKNNLPDLDRYIDSFCEIQFSAFEAVRQIDKKDFKSLKENYFNLNFKLNDKGLLLITKTEFIQSLKNTIIPLHQIAYNQGYQIWS